jgi:hypothetical protein
MNYNVKSYNLIGGQSLANIISALPTALDNPESLWEEADTGSGYIIITPKDALKLIRIGLISTSNHVIIDEQGLIAGAPGSNGDSWLTLAPRAIRVTYNPSFASGSPFQFIQTDDAIFILPQDASGFYTNGLHAGRIFTPFLANDPDNGMAGYGALIGGLRMSSTITSNLWGTVGTTNSTVVFTTNNRVRTGLGAGDVAQAWINHGVGATQSRTSNVLSAIDVGNRKQPVPLIVSVNAQPNISTNSSGISRPIGVLRYVFVWPWTTGNKTVLKASDSDQAFVALSNTESLLGFEYPLIPWEDPDFQIV